jgi:hypothetical protein
LFFISTPPSFDLDLRGFSSEPHHGLRFIRATAQVSNHTTAGASTTEAQNHFKKRGFTVGRHPKKKKAKKALAASDVLVPQLPNSVPPAAAHPQEEVPLAFPPNPVPPVVLDRGGGLRAAAEQAADDKIGH